MNEEFFGLKDVVVEVGVVDLKVPNYTRNPVSYVNASVNFKFGFVIVKNFNLKRD